VVNQQGEEKYEGDKTICIHLTLEKHVHFWANSSPVNNVHADVGLHASGPSRCTMYTECASVCNLVVVPAETGTVWSWDVAAHGATISLALLVADRMVAWNAFAWVLWRCLCSSIGGFHRSGHGQRDKANEGDGQWLDELHVLVRSRSD